MAVKLRILTKMRGNWKMQLSHKSLPLFKSVLGCLNYFFVVILGLSNHVFICRGFISSNVIEWDRMWKEVVMCSCEVMYCNLRGGT